MLNNSQKCYTISELSDRTGLPVHTIRYRIKCNELPSSGKRGKQIVYSSDVLMVLSTPIDEWNSGKKRYPSKINSEYNVANTPGVMDHLSLEIDTLKTRLNDVESQTANNTLIDGIQRLQSEHAKILETLSLQMTQVLHILRKMSEWKRSVDLRLPADSE